MPANPEVFMFDANYSFGVVSVFTLVDLQGSGSSPPPTENFLLETNNTPLRLTPPGEFMLLA